MMNAARLFDPRLAALGACFPGLWAGAGFDSGCRGWHGAVAVSGGDRDAGGELSGRA